MEGGGGERGRRGKAEGAQPGGVQEREGGEGGIARGLEENFRAEDLDI